MNAKTLNNSTYKTIYSLRIMLELKKLGFEPLLEMDNIYKPPLRCWLFLRSSAFDEALTSIMEGRISNGQ